METCGFRLKLHCSVLLRIQLTSQYLVQVMVWHRSIYTGDKPLCESIMAQHTGTYMCHSAMISLYVICLRVDTHFIYNTTETRLLGITLTSFRTDCRLAKGNWMNHGAHCLGMELIYRTCYFDFESSSGICCHPMRKVYPSIGIGFLLYNVRFRTFIWECEIHVFLIISTRHCENVDTVFFLWILWIYRYGLCAVSYRWMVFYLAEIRHWATTLTNR